MRLIGRVMNAVERPAQSSSMDNFSNSQIVRKQVVAARGGVVAAQHRRAAEVGAAVLETGGDTVYAAVATSFAIGVVEPWMSGPAAGGCMVLWRADGSRAHVVDYGMRSPRALDPANYPLTGDGKVSRLFPWPTVVGDRNVQGANRGRRARRGGRHGGGTPCIWPQAMARLGVAGGAAGTSRPDRRLVLRTADGFGRARLVAGPGCGGHVPRRGPLPGDEWVDDHAATPPGPEDPCGNARADRGRRPRRVLPRRPCPHAITNKLWQRAQI